MLVVSLVFRVVMTGIYEHPVDLLATRDHQYGVLMFGEII
jgi:hypothetical protein